MIHLSEKELLELNERITGHEATVEKLGVFMSQCQDPALRQMLQTHQQVYMTHYNALVNMANQGSSQITQQQSTQSTDFGYSSFS